MLVSRVAECSHLLTSFLAMVSDAPQIHYFLEGIEILFSELAFYKSFHPTERVCWTLLSEINFFYTYSFN